MSKAKLHLKGIPCNTFSPYGVEETEDEDKVTCKICRVIMKNKREESCYIVYLERLLKECLPYVRPTDIMARQLVEKVKEVIK